MTSSDPAAQARPCDPAQAWARGIEHFNRGEYFESHEVWEAAWLHERGERRTALQALILAAVSLHHMRAGNVVGARRTWSRAVGRFASLPTEFDGVNLAALSAAVESIVAAGRADFAPPTVGSI